MLGHIGQAEDLSRPYPERGVRGTTAPRPPLPQSGMARRGEAQRPPAKLSFRHGPPPPGPRPGGATGPGEPARRCPFCVATGAPRPPGPHSHEVAWPGGARRGGRPPNSLSGTGPSPPGPRPGRATGPDKITCWEGEQFPYALCGEHQGLDVRAGWWYLCSVSCGMNGVRYIRMFCTILCFLLNYVCEKYAPCGEHRAWM